MEEGLDWDRWLGPAPIRGYSSVLSPRGVHQHFPAWRNYREYSGGMMTDWGAHHFDIAQWGLGMDGNGPIAIEATGTPPATDPNSYNCHPTFKVAYTYANGAKLICSDRQLEGAPDPKGTKTAGRNSLDA